MKTLAVILHYNTFKYTDDLFEMLAPEQASGNYDLIVVDNGSDPGKSSKYVTWNLNENVFFGGGLNACFEMMMENTEYDSLLFLNNDLIVGNNFVATLRKELAEFAVVSPCIIQPEKTQNYWKQMQSWGLTKTRPVRWIDLQCPLISRKFIQHIHDTKTNEYYIDPVLIRGWGIDVFFGIICETQGWKTGVCDYAPAVHLGSMTLKALGNTTEYCQKAELGMHQFFQSNQLMKEFTELRTWAEQYKI